MDVKFSVSVYSTVINYEIFLHLSNLLNDIFILAYHHMSLYLAIC